jgi:hypothetical protein
MPYALTLSNFVKVLENNKIDFKSKVSKKQYSLNLAYTSNININKPLYTYSPNPYYKSDKAAIISNAIITNNN